MPPEVTPGEARVELSRLTGMSEAEWDDFFSLPPDAQMVVVQNYRDAVWVQSRDTLVEVLAVLGMLAEVAGAVSGVAGAISAIRAL